MKNIRIIPADPAFLEEVNPAMPAFEEADYRERLDILAERMIQKGLSHVVVFADREHFANMEYLTGFEPRFEEALLVVDQNGDCTVITGNECLPYSHISPVRLNRILYQNFSLQGQPRESIRPLRDIFRECGIKGGTTVGLVGYKYFEASHALGNPDEVFDVPAYILNELAGAGNTKIINFTSVMTGMPDGIRMKIRTAKEVAWAEYTACKTTGVIQRLFKNLKPGVSELELSEKGKLDFSPVSVFPMLNFGTDHCKVGLRSPDYNKLKVGDNCGLCYGVRGSLVSRVGIAAYGEETLNAEYKRVIEKFYKPFWSAIATWYESLYTGVSTKEVFDKVMNIIGGPEFGVILNPGHYIGGDEWVNSPFSKDSTARLEHSSHLQCDIIVSSGNPYMTGICEDSIILADRELRSKVAVEYPSVWARITGRQKLMREVLGIDLKDDVLPLGNLNGVYFPYMLNTDLIFSAS